MLSFAPAPGGSDDYYEVRTSNMCGLVADIVIR